MSQKQTFKNTEIKSKTGLSVSVAYVLDPTDLVISTQGAWNGFAAENEAPGAVSEAILGQKLWDFVDGFETSSFLNTVFFWCRHQSRSFETLYRNDSPTMSRLYRMIVDPHDKGHLWIGHKFITSSKREEPVINLDGRRGGSRCSICCRFKTGDSWIDPFSAPSPYDVPKSHVVCPECRSRTETCLRNGGVDNVIKLFAV